LEAILSSFNWSENHRAGQRASELRLFPLLQEQNPSMYQRSSSHIYIAARTITRTKAPMRSSL
ncbi:MAG: hypothetical protein V4803_26340, partial [Burkholderia gladioli]